MKLPVNFGGKLFYRVMLPGAILTSTAFLVLRPGDRLVGYEVSFPLVFVVATLVIGMLFLFLDRPIYMLLEGRRFWPGWLRRVGIRLERNRLARIHRTMRVHDLSRGCNNCKKEKKLEFRRRYLEAAADLTEFPVDPVSSNPTVFWPTRLGNLIAAYEQYPDRKYGLDSVFFWPRLWISISSDQRSELDSQQAQADGAVYGSVALFFSFCLISSTSIYAYFFQASVVHVNSVFISASTLLISYFVYRISAYSYQYFGELFMATFDVHRHLIEVSSPLSILSEEIDADFDQCTTREKNRAAWRFLKWHRFRPPGKSSNIRLKF